MAGYATFLCAVSSTVSSITGGNNRFSSVNGFTISYDETDGVYSVEGEGEEWGFYMVFDTARKEWFVIGDMYSAQT